MRLPDNVPYPFPGFSNNRWQVFTSLSYLNVERPAGIFGSSLGGIGSLPDSIKPGFALRSHDPRYLEK